MSFSTDIKELEQEWQRINDDVLRNEHDLENIESSETYHSYAETLREIRTKIEKQKEMLGYLDNLIKRMKCIAKIKEVRDELLEQRQKE